MRSGSFLMFSCFALACAGSEGPVDGGGPVDTGVVDGSFDAGPEDTGVADSGPEDAGVVVDWQTPIRTLLDKYVEAGWTPGFSVGVWRDGHAEFLSVGRVDSAREGAPTPDTIYELASVTKLFTTLRLALAVEQGLVSLDTPLQDLVPQGVTVPDLAGNPILLRHLATHTAGLPAWPPAALPSPAPGAVSVTAIDAEALYADLSNTTLSVLPGHVIGYSSFGVALLGQALLPATGAADLDALLRADIGDPLGLTDTGLELTADQEARLAPPHLAPDQPMPRLLLGALSPAASLQGSARDLTRLLGAELEPPAGALGAAIRATQVSRVVNGDTVVGLGWFKVTWRNVEILMVRGDAYGGHATVVICPSAGVGVVLLTNARIDTDIEAVSVAVLDEARGMPWSEAGLVIPDPDPTITPPLAELEALAGVYRHGETVLELVLHEGRLYAHFDAGSYFRLFASAEDTFYLRRLVARMLVVRDGGGVITGVRWLQTGDNLYTRDP
ncbi:MAG: serine hydrolase [Myxococcales bacterium]|nr:serine hydrolase [Myxococcales bacterium]